MAPDGQALSTEDRDRVKAALEEGRRWHHVSYWIFFTSTLFAISGAKELRVPGLDFPLQRREAAVAFFLAVVALTAVAFRMLFHVLEHLRRDNGVAFAWIVLGRNGRPSVAGAVYLIVPVLGTALAAAHCLGGPLFVTFEMLAVFGLGIVTAVALESAGIVSVRVGAFLLTNAIGFLLSLVALLLPARSVMNIVAPAVLMTSIVGLGVATAIARSRGRKIGPAAATQGTGTGAST
jgi:hypothetical protein